MSSTRGPLRTRSASRWPARLNGAPSIQRVVKPSVRSSALKTSPTCRTPARFIVPLLMLTTRSSSASAASWSASTAAAIVDTSFESPGCPGTRAVAVIARQAIAMSFMGRRYTGDSPQPEPFLGTVPGDCPQPGPSCGHWGLSPIAIHLGTVPNTHARAARHRALSARAPGSRGRATPRAREAGEPVPRADGGSAADVVARRGRPPTATHRQADRLRVRRAALPGAAPDDRGTAALEGRRRRAHGPHEPRRVRLFGRHVGPDRGRIRRSAPRFTWWRASRRSTTTTPADSKCSARRRRYLPHDSPASAAR